MSSLSKIALVIMLMMGAGCGSYDENVHDKKIGLHPDPKVMGSEPIAMCQTELGTFILVGVVLALNLISCQKDKEKDTKDT